MQRRTREASCYVDSPLGPSTATVRDFVALQPSSATYTLLIASTLPVGSDDISYSIIDLAMMIKPVCPLFKDYRCKDGVHFMFNIQLLRQDFFFFFKKKKRRKR